MRDSFQILDKFFQFVSLNYKYSEDDMGIIYQKEHSCAVLENFQIHPNIIKASVNQGSCNINLLHYDQLLIPLITNWHSKMLIDKI